ncbi:hypothetical protein Megpolyxen_01783 (plasmid) [Candidatus Megaera polyxenophila]|nr:hypothetical protein Megpolyxen_01783 [Candidatus Megaera polyxenophila]
MIYWKVKNKTYTKFMIDSGIFVFTLLVHPLFKYPDAYLCKILDINV